MVYTLSITEGALKMKIENKKYPGMVYIIHNHGFNVIDAIHEYDLIQFYQGKMIDMGHYIVPERLWAKEIKSLEGSD